MKKILLIMVLVLLVGCTTKENSGLKNDYESLNDKYLKVTINDSKLQKKEFKDIDSIIKNKGLIYFCLPTSNYCRNNIEVLIELINDLELDNVYYIDLTNVRDTFDEGYNITKEGSKDYKVFLEKYSDTLSSLELHKYVFDGDIMLFDNGEVIDYLTSNTYNLEINKKLSEEEKKQEYNRLYNFLKTLLDTESCDQDDDTGC